MKIGTLVGNEDQMLDVQSGNKLQVNKESNNSTRYYNCDTPLTFTFNSSSIVCNLTSRDFYICVEVLCTSCFHSLLSTFIYPLHDVASTDADDIIVSLIPSWLSWSWKDSSEGRRRSNWGSTTSLTLTVLFHHLYHGDTWSWRRRDKCERRVSRRDRAFSRRFKLSRQFQLSGAKGSPLDKSGSSDASRVPSDEKRIER